MNYLIIIISVIFLGCSSSKQSIENTKEGKYVYSSGNLSGTDYIMIMKKKGSKRQFWIIMNCNHYIRGIGKVFYMSKEIYSLEGNYVSTVRYIKDTSMLSNLNVPQSESNNFTKLSDEEYEVIKKSFTKYPTLTAKYSLNADSLKNYLGWFEVKK